jgi:hypothetical protein
MATGSRFGWAATATVLLAAAATAQVPMIPGAAPPAIPGAAPPVVPGAAAAVPGAPQLPGGGVAPPTTGVGSVGGVGGVGTGAGTGAAGGQTKNLWSYILRTPEQKAQCKQHIVQIGQTLTKCKVKFCSSQIGQLTNGLLAPIGPITGGLLGPICPMPIGPGGPNSAAGPGVVNPADLAKDPTTPEGAAARIKLEENPAVIQAKIAALQFLGTVDCRYYPEAAAGLITGLRAEKNECVRLAAAKSLANGCCCNPKIVKALLMVVNCSNKDGFPIEASELVRAYAFVALERCMRRCAEAESEAPPEPPPAAKAAIYETLAPLGPTADAHTHILLASYFPPTGGEAPEAIFAEARATLARGLKLSPETVSRLSGPRNVADAVLPAVAMPRLTPAAVIARLDAVVAYTARGPLEKPATFITTLPKREPQPEPAAEPQPRQFVMTASAPIEPGKVIPVSMTTGPTMSPPTGPPPAPRSISGLWKDANKK